MGKEREETGERERERERQREREREREAFHTHLQRELSTSFISLVDINLLYVTSRIPNT